MPQRPDDEDDWYFPKQQESPESEDIAAVPPGLAGAMNLLAPRPELPLGTAYSPRRNKYRLPNGQEIDAGDFRPLARDRNTFGPSDIMRRRMQMLAIGDEGEA